MRLIELEIHNIRGIKELKLKPDGENLLIWGPNGSGKSGVVDAIDFLLTGDISRLTGDGTGDINLNKHGKHIDNTDLKNSTVRAVVKLSSNHKEIELIRSMDKPKLLAYPVEHKEEVEELLSFASRGQHVLTRREILKYITAQSKTRANEIQLLLNLSRIEVIRSSLTSTRNTCKKLLDDSKRNLISLGDRIKEILKVGEFSETTSLEKVNDYRKTLNAPPLDLLKSSLLKTDISFQKATSSDKTVTVTADNFSRDLEYIESVQSPETIQSIKSEQALLMDAIDELIADPLLLENLKRERLIDFGLELIDESGSCPLCDTQWEQDKLKEYLTKKKENANAAQTILNRLRDSSDKLLRIFDKTNAAIKRVLSAIEQHEQLSAVRDALRTRGDVFDDVHTILSDYTDLYKNRDILKEKLELIQDEGLKSLSHSLSEFSATLGKSSPEDDAWDNLTRLEGYLRDYENAKIELKQNEALLKRATILLESFIESRDKILSALYAEIQEKFIALYRHLHGPDEENFDAELKPEQAGLYFGVDFHGRGKHPPHALHSEGHQDSMGLCLYLVLSERLNQNMINLIILDDVVMSIDSDHRKNVCSLFKEYYGSKQLIITTHDKTWANQIKHAGVVKANQCVEFYDWKVDTGPGIKNLLGMWERIEDHLLQNNVSNAAFELRNGSEEYFSEVCHLLRANIRFDIQGKNDAGEYIHGAQSQYKRLLADARKVAESWGKKEEIEKLDELNSLRKQIYGRIGNEQWAINAIVHFNNWATTFSVKDFRPVVEAFQDFFAIFKCQGECGDFIRLILDENKNEVAVRCACQAINWNLVLKPREHSQ